MSTQLNIILGLIHPKFVVIQERVDYHYVIAIVMGHIWWFTLFFSCSYNAQETIIENIHMVGF